MAPKGTIRSKACPACKKKKKGCPHKDWDKAGATAALGTAQTQAAPAAPLQPLPTSQAEEQALLPNLRARPSVPTESASGQLQLLVRLPISVTFDHGLAEVTTNPPTRLPTFVSPPPPPQSAVSHGRPSSTLQQQPTPPVPRVPGSRAANAFAQAPAPSASSFSFTASPATSSPAIVGGIGVPSSNRQIILSDSMFNRYREGEPTPPTASQLNEHEDSVMTDAPTQATPSVPPTPRAGMPSRLQQLLNQSSSRVPPASSSQRPSQLPTMAYAMSNRIAQQMPPPEHEVKAMDINFYVWQGGNTSPDQPPQQQSERRDSVFPYTETAAARDFADKWLRPLNGIINNWSETANPALVLKGYNILKDFGQEARQAGLTAKHFPVAADDKTDYKANRQLNLASAARRAHELNRQSIETWALVREGKKTVEGQTIGMLGVKRLHEIEQLLKMDREAQDQLK